MINYPQLVSLWDMLEIKAYEFVQLGRVLTDVERTTLSGVKAGDTLSDHHQSQILEIFTATSRLCRKLDMPVSVSVLRDHRREFKKSPPTYLQIQDDFKAIRLCIRAELGSRFVLSLSSAEGNWYEHGPEPFGAAVSQNFPSAAYDIREACKCIGLGRDTAAVFHLMRTAEKGLNALAVDVGISLPPATSNWHNIIEQIESTITAAHSGPKTPTKSVQLQFWSEAALDLKHFKEAWRNHVMHGRAQYDPDAAAKVMLHVKAFMMHLAKNGLKE